jgi:tetratricopeptide (TPR) repeat protein
VATGNLEMIGWIKVEEAGLRQWFRFGGFSDHFPIRSELIGQAANKAREMAGRGASICVVGDTPRDIEAARANFLSVIAVATGKYSFDELLQCISRKSAPPRWPICWRINGRQRAVPHPFAFFANGWETTNGNGASVNSVFRQVLRLRSLTESLCATALLLAILPATSVAQAFAPASPSPIAPQVAPSDSASPEKNAKPENLPRGSDRRRAARLFLAASKLFQNQQFDEALPKYQQAAALDPTNRNYALAVELTRSHAVTALIQAAAKDRILGNAKTELAALQRALELDPRNIQVTEHLHEMGDEAVRGEGSPIYAQGADTVGASVPLEPTPGVHSFHLHTDQRTAIQQVFKAYGLQPTVDDSIRFAQVRLDMDDASFEQAMRTIGLLTNSFYVPLDAHRVLVARDTPENRQQFQRLDLETIYLPGLASANSPMWEPWPRMYLTCNIPRSIRRRGPSPCARLPRP